MRPAPRRPGCPSRRPRRRPARACAAATRSAAATSSSLPRARRRRPGGPSGVPVGARRDRRPIRVGGVGVKLCVLGVDRVRTEDCGQRGCKLDQLRNRRLHLLTTELALPFNCCQGHVQDSSKLVTRRHRHRRRNVRGEGHRRRRGRRGARAPRGRRTRCRRRKPGWSEQNPDDWWQATEQALDGLTDGVAGIGLSGQMHGLVTLDAARPPDPAGDPLERPAHRRRVRGDRGARRLRPARRADRQPRADRLHGAQAAVAAQARARALRPHRARDAAQGLRAAAAHRRAGDRRRRRLAARCCSTSRSGAGATRCCDALEIDRGVAADRARVARGLAAARRRASPSRPAPATRRRAGSASASTARGRCSVAMGTSGVVFAALPEYRADPQARVHAFCHAVPGAWHQMGVMLSAARLAALAARRRRRRVHRADRRGRGVGAGSRGADVPAVPDRRAHARTPTRTRAARSPAWRSATTAARWCARCSRAWPAALRDSLRPACGGGERGRVSAAAARAASCGCRSSPPCSRSRSSASPSRRARPTARRCSAASPAGSGATSHEAVGALRAHASEVEPVPEWIDAYRALRERYRALYPALQAKRGAP